jgi:hypothetical protein
MPLRSPLQPVARASVLALAAILMAGCGRTQAETSRSDSLALAASGGVRTDSGAVPMRVGGDRRRQADSDWSEVLPPLPPPMPEALEDRVVIVEVDDGADDAADARHEAEMRLEEARHEMEMRIEEAAAAAAAVAEAQAAVVAAEAEAAMVRAPRRDARRARGHRHSHTMPNRP